MELFKGKIKDFSGSWGSGLGTLHIEDSETGSIQGIPCENAQTVRCLEAAFGNTITDAHTANGSGYKNKVVYWAYDDMGLTLGWFIPIKEASQDKRIASDYRKSRAKRQKEKAEYCKKTGASHTPGELKSLLFGR